MKYSYIQSALPYPFTETDLPLPEKTTGKVRDIYKPEDGKLLLVTTDRLSVFDRVLGSAPFKGQVLNQLSAWWFEQIQGIIPSHLISLPDPNALLAQEVESFPVEVIVRGTTSQQIVAMLRTAGAREVHLRVTCPPIAHPCFMGVDMPTHEELIAHNLCVDDICAQLGADSLHYLSMDGMMGAIDSENGYCNACFTGSYPFSINDHITKEALETVVEC